jgi:hypothetical protein
MSSIRTIVLGLMLLLKSALADQSVTLAWDANPEPDVSGYFVYYGTASRNYPYSTNVGNVTTATVYGLPEGVTWYFAVTAMNTTGLESDFSNEVTNQIPSNVTNHVPTIQPLLNIVILEDGVTNVVLLIMDDETPASQLVVTATSTNTTLVANASLVLSGTNETRYLVISPTKGRAGITLITVIVSDGSKASSTSFLLDVIGAQNTPSKPSGVRVVSTIIIVAL